MCSAVQNTAVLLHDTGLFYVTFGCRIVDKLQTFLAVCFHYARLLLAWLQAAALGGSRYER